ncbi:hypothetical protein RRF57_009231 [Xylaria bambusicola]|uniref:Uncharacterized protein n=1 Tax=Xylaria bambusicola TaxID=326684 RepID=A0AAN7ZBU5_9PEZI
MEGVKTYDPSSLQGDHVIDIDIRGRSPDTPIIGRRPGAAGRVAVAADSDIGAVALEHVLARVTGSLNSDPRWEEVSFVLAVVGVGTDCEGR